MRKQRMGILDGWEAWEKPEFQWLLLLLVCRGPFRLREDPLVLLS